MVEPKVSRFYVTVIIEWVNVAVHTVIPGGTAKTRGGVLLGVSLHHAMERLVCPRMY